MIDTIDPVSAMKLVSCGSSLAATWMHMGFLIAHELGYSFPCAAGDCARDDGSMCVGFGPGHLQQGLHRLAELAKNK